MLILISIPAGIEFQHDQEYEERGIHSSLFGLILMGFDDTLDSASPHQQSLLTFFRSCVSNVEYRSIRSLVIAHC